jgi:PHD/YefM family antitoxin component YafN of YafNO toxin-antitoxin module
VTTEGAEVAIPRLLWQTRDGTAVQQSDLICPAKATPPAQLGPGNQHRVKQPNRSIGATISAMQTFTANQAKTQFGQFIDLAQREPVRVMRRDRVVGVMVSAQDYEAMRAFYANRLQHTLAQTALDAEQAGLTPEALEALLSDES